MNKIYTLNNGIRLVYEKMPHIKSVSVGIYVKSGSMYETTKENGISHFIEHMLFKGTQKRSAKKIAEEMDFVGGHINAYTARDYTCFHTKVLSENLALCVDILSDMYYNSIFKEEDIELERSVIIEEINMCKDVPEDIVIDGIIEKMWCDHPMGFLISGTEESVSKITREMMLDYMSRRYTPQNTVISVVGSFNEAQMTELMEKHFAKSAPSCADNIEKVKFHSGIWERKKEIEQTHLAITFPTFPLSSDKVHTFLILNNILGASMSSRLFQKLREESGLCYSVYSFSAEYSNAGFMGIYAGLADETLDKAMKMIDDEIERISKEKVTDFELQKTLSQIRCAFVMGREHSDVRMSRYGKALLLKNKLVSDKKELSLYERVSADDIIECANEVFDKNNRGVYILRPL